MMVLQYLFEWRTMPKTKNRFPEKLEKELLKNHV